MASMDFKSVPIVFAVDGKKHVVENPDPAVMLVEYMRQKGITAAKIGCGEGGCGSCTVTVASWAGTAPKFRSVNSCLLALCSCDGLSITTSMGLGNSKLGYHPIQEALAAANGSQCGYCSPGMVMSCFGMLSSTKGDTLPDALRIESCVDGNLCRCTGYRPILEAFRSFAGKPKSEFAGETFAPFPDFLKDRLKDATNRQHGAGGKLWLSPGSQLDLLETIKEQTLKGSKWMLVGGHTCKGIYKDEHLTDVFVSVGRVQELQNIEIKEQSIDFGAAVTWGDFIAVLEEQSTRGGAAVLLEHARKVAGHSVRNLGTLGGNLAMTKRRGFASDLATMLAGIGASVTMVTPQNQWQTTAVDAFFMPSMAFPEDALLMTISVPTVPVGTVYKSYRTALRPVNSHALTNAAFRVKMEAGKVESAHLIFGAHGGASQGPVRAIKTEREIVGKEPSDACMAAAVEAMKSESWFPEDVFERHLCAGYLQKFFHTLQGSKDGDMDAPVLGVCQSSERPVNQGTGKVGWATPEFAPIAVGMEKLSSKLQTAGEQQFTGDLPEPANCLHAAYAVVPRADAMLKSYDASAAEASPGFFGVLTASDIPGMNVWELSFTHKMLVDVGSESQYAGQPFLLVLADTQRHAELAAKKVTMELEFDKKPKLTKGCAKEAQAHVDSGSMDHPNQPWVKLVKKYSRGDVPGAMSSAPRQASGEAFCDGQKAFYMECPVALAVPGEDGTLNVWGSFQVASWAHTMTAVTTKLPKHKIVMNATHIGGGFGGKLMKSLHSVVAASLAAQKTGFPVKCTVNRNMDTAICGGRLPNTFDYDVGFDDAGKILSLKVDSHADAGQGDGCAGFAATISVKNAEQIYWLPNAEFTVHQVRTHKPGNTAVRGPGEPQSSFMMETIINRVAEELDVSQQQVREVNIFNDLADREKCLADPTSKEIEKYSPLFASGTDIDGKDLKDFPALGIWMSLKQKVDFEKKAAEVAKFNTEHKWRKRGVAMTPVKYAVNTRKQQCLVNLYDDGTCLITSDGSEIGQGLHTKIIQYASYYLSQIVPGSDVSVDKIRVGPLGTDKVSHGSITGGSTTSEGVCEAVRDAIGKLRANLNPFLEAMKEEEEKAEATGSITFQKLVQKAAGGDAEMQASGRNPASIDYHIYGAACSEVEVDVLTGETVILSTSMLYDCGKSLNPTIDRGQCEGGFVMGVGFFLRERLLQDDATGKLESDGTWEYKIPCFQDVPVKFDVEFFPRAFESGIVSSKASGEPPLVLATSVFCAVKEAVMAGRKEFGQTAGALRLDAPATPRDIALAIGAVGSQAK